jgi:holo-[acyl-carrier protein] synthase
MVDAIGIDIVEIDRIRRALERHGERFLGRILSDRERVVCDKRADRAQFVAGRFAGKEAVVKALGRFLDTRPPWRVIEILNDAGGQPVVVLPPDVQARLDGRRLLVSISHERHNAVAMAIITTPA